METRTERWITRRIAALLLDDRVMAPTVTIVVVVAVIVIMATVRVRVRVKVAAENIVAWRRVRHGQLRRLLALILIPRTKKRLHAITGARTLRNKKRKVKREVTVDATEVEEERETKKTKTST